MLNVRVQFGVGLGSGGAREAALEVPDGSTVGDIVELLLERGLLVTGGLPDDGSPTGIPARLSVFLDGINIRYRDGEATPLSEGARVHILALLAGG